MFQGYRYDQLSDEDLQLKVDISRDLLRVLGLLEPGCSKSRGITVSRNIFPEPIRYFLAQLLDLAECEARAVLRRRGGLEELARVETILEEAHDILQYEDESAIEGNVAKKARIDLAQLRQHIASLKRDGRT